MSLTSLLHGNATARHLGALRIWVFGMWFADVLKDPLTDLAAIPFSYFEPVGVLRWLPESFWSAVHTEGGLRLWWIVLLVLLGLSAAGTRYYRGVAVVACVMLTFYQGMIFGFADVTHAELVALYTTYILAVFPAADALALRRVRVLSPAPVYQAALLAATITLLATYMLTGVRRLFAGGVDIFLDGTILSMVADGAATPDHFQRSVGLWTLASPLGTTALQVGFALVTVFEILSLWCVSSTWFRRGWLAVMLPFHALSWPLLQTLFLHNILLIVALLFDVDGIVRRWRASPPLRAGALGLLLVLGLSACATRPHGNALPGFAPYGRFGESILVLHRTPGVTVTLVAPARIDLARRVELILYALPNGNTTAETMGRRLADGAGWRFDIQHIAAQTRMLRTMGIPQAIVAYLEADTKSWPEWRRAQGYERANARIVALVDEVRTAIGNPPRLVVTLAGHSGGGSFMFGFIEGQQALPSWLERVAFLDANYNFAPPHGDQLVEWLRHDRDHTLVVLAYDDREIMLDGKKVVSDSGGTWRASHRMLDYLQGTASLPFTTDTLGGFVRYRAPQIDILLHPNPGNRILHTEMIGEMNGYMHALLARRPEYERGSTLLKPARAYERWIDSVTPSINRLR